MTALLITGGHIIDPSTKTDIMGSVLVEDGRIAALFASEERQPSGDIQQFDATGMVVCPGFVDIHTHLRYPGQPDKETIASGTSAAIRGGFTTICAMANSDPPVDSAKLVETVLASASLESRCSVHVVGAVSHELKGRVNADAGELKRAGAIALSDDGNPVMSSVVMERALRDSDRLGLPVSAHEETRDGSISGAPNSCWQCAGETEMIRRDIKLCGTTGGKLHIAHVSCADSIELIAEAQVKGIPVTAEATPHHLALTDEIWSGSGSLPADHGLAKVNPPLRSSADRDALQQAVISGVISSIATDHAPHTHGEKCRPAVEAAFGFTAFELALPLLLRLVRSGTLPLSTMIERLTSGPAATFQLAVGSLSVGRQADICVFDPERAWTPSRDTLISKGKNTPILGTPMTGRVMATIVGGRKYEFAEDHGLRALRTS